MRKESGFTLIELMVVIAIVAILASLAIPNFISWLPKRHLQSAASDIQSTIQLARLEAIKANATVVLTFNPGGDDYTVFIDNGAGANAGNGVQDADERTLRANEMPPGIDMTAADFSGVAAFQFDGRGLANAGGKVTVKNKLNQIKEINVNLAGSSKVE
jgi:prepilin-type N-terminal cleavage/methylation domain-containing protein